jgi:hypothetical protein
MLIKEYRIPLPLTLKEYSIAQLYMIQALKKQFQLLLLFNYFRPPIFVSVEEE